MKILLVGALSWNPERLRSLAEQGHSLWGLWSRSMAWDQGPYPATDGSIRPVALEDASSTIREEGIDCVYSLFQVYRRRLWGPSRPGVEHGVWTLLRALLRARARGHFDAPVVGHWGFDLHNLDSAVVRALDGQLLCNAQKLEYLRSPRERGGCGVDLFDGQRVELLDSDRPKLEFMNDRFGPHLSERAGEIHTVCIGRPFDIDYVAAARRGIHVHVYGNGFDGMFRALARDLVPKDARPSAELIGQYLHLHPSRQTIGSSWPEIQRVKGRWVEEFSQYDAAWSYLGRPFPWEPLDDRAAIPNRLGTSLLAGLPVIADRRPGWYRYDELERLGVAIDLVDSDYDGLRDRLEEEVTTREKRDRARATRGQYSFEATIEPLLGALERAREGYFAKPHAERTRFDSSGDGSLIHLGTSLRVRARAQRRSLPREGWRGLRLPWQATRLSKRLRSRIDDEATNGERAG